MKDASPANGKRVDCKELYHHHDSNLGARANDTNNIGFGQELGHVRAEEDRAMKDFFRPNCAIVLIQSASSTN
jgi:hypothetical protein